MWHRISVLCDVWPFSLPQADFPSTHVRYLLALPSPQCLCTCGGPLVFRLVVQLLPKNPWLSSDNLLNLIGLKCKLPKTHSWNYSSVSRVNFVSRCVVNIFIDTEFSPFNETISLNPVLAHECPKGHLMGRAEDLVRGTQADLRAGDKGWYGRV